MSSSPTLAVIIPNYNYEEFVGRAIDSVISQNDGRVELIVVDDGSTDASWSIICGYDTLKRVRVPNGGPLRACRHGLGLTTAPFVLFLDADDELKPGSLKRILGALDGGVSKLQFALTRVDRHGSPIGDSPALDDYRDSDNLKRQVLAKGVYRSPPTSGNVFRRDLCQIIHDVDYDTSVDGILIYAAPFFGEVVSISEELGLYRIHERNLSSIGSTLDVGHMERELKRFQGQMQHLNRVLSELGYERNAVKYEMQFIAKERMLQIGIVKGTRPTIGFVVDFMLQALSEKMEFKHKMGICLIALLSLCMDNARMLAAISYRLKPGTRSASGLLRTMLAARPAA